MAHGDPEAAPIYTYILCGYFWTSTAQELFANVNCY